LFVLYHLLVVEERVVVDALEHKDTENGQKKNLKEVENFQEDERGHAVVLVVLIDACEELVQVVYV